MAVEIWASLGSGTEFRLDTFDLARLHNRAFLPQVSFFYDLDHNAPSPVLGTGEYQPHFSVGI